jgi:hypothetical protein
MWQRGLLLIRLVRAPHLWCQRAVSCRAPEAPVLATDGIVIQRFSCGGGRAARMAEVWPMGWSSTHGWVSLACPQCLAPACGDHYGHPGEGSSRKGRR